MSEQEDAKTQQNRLVWEFECSCGEELELPAEDTDFSPTGLRLPECENCGEWMRHVGPVIDECDNCGQGLLYKGNSGLGKDTLCDGCYDDMQVMM